MIDIGEPLGQFTYRARTNTIPDFVMGAYLKLVTLDVINNLRSETIMSIRKDGRWLRWENYNWKDV